MSEQRALLVVKVTCGVEAPERLNQALTVAATAVAGGVEVSLWLTGDATWLAVPGRAESWTCRMPRRWPSCATRCWRRAGSRCVVSARRAAS